MKHNNLFLAFLLISSKAFAFQSPFKDAQLSIGHSDLEGQKYEYALKFKLYGVEEFKKWRKVKEIDRRFKSINSQFINSETDLNNIRNFIQAVDIKQKQKQYAEYNKWMSRFRDSLTATYENSNTDVSTVFKIIAADEDKQLLGLELNEQKNELMPLLSQMRITWDQVPEEAVLNVKNIHQLIDTLDTSSLASQSGKAYDLYARLSMAEYEYKRAEDLAVFDGFEVTYEKDYEKSNSEAAIGLKAVFNLNFLREEKTLYYSDRYNLQRKLLTERTNTQTRTNELKNIKATLKDDIELMQSLQKSSFKEDKFLSNKKNIYSVIDLQTIQGMQKNKFEKNAKLISLKTTILDKILTLMYETERPLTLMELRKYVK
ncbi:MAG: hypothetical protein V4654_11545 [Bdellovibrionota bacterium]